MLKTELIGNLVRDPETNTSQTGEPMTTFTVAVNRRSGQQEYTDYVNCAAFGRLGEICVEFLAKGKKVWCEGRPYARAWTGRDGQPRAALHMSVSSMEMLSPRGQAAPAAAEPTPPPPAPEDFTEVDDDELPFNP